ncbi:MAG: alpha/beta fold hydrolase [Alphaproteobacteria bacterium]|nr:alpha/beta fold hydrolase [Alphaproteobacteria bacterium]MBL7097282.1 alpha/beta fold hydrolase [Alphaproteobacteria bacterium]
MTSHFTEVNGLKIHYDEIGSGAPLIFCHGGGPGSSGLSNFSKNMRAFAGKHRVIAIDLPGYGQSTKLKIAEPLWGFYAKVLAGFIDKLGLGKADLVGNSLGGAASLKTALDFPEKVRRLVLMGPGGGYSLFEKSPSDGIRALLTFYMPPGPSIERLKNFVQYLVFDPSTITDDLLAQRLKRALDPETAEYMPLRIGPNMAPITELWRERLDQVPHETLIIWGREDRVNPMDQGLILMRQIPNARFLVMPKCGHWAQWEKADEFNRLVGDFLGN